MAKTLTQRYDERNHQSGKVITPDHREADIVTKRAAVRTERETRIGVVSSAVMGRNIDDALVVRANVNVGERVILVTVSTTPTTDHRICLKEGVSFFGGQVLSVVADGGDDYTLTVDSPFDFAFTTASGCSLMSSKMNVNGSVTPVIFSMSPEGLDVGTQWVLRGLTVHIVDGADMDDTKFGGITGGIENGLVIRQTNEPNKNFVNIKTNGGFGDHGFDVKYVAKAGGGLYAVRNHVNFEESFGSSIGMESLAVGSDSFDMIVQDDLSALTELHAFVHFYRAIQ